ncbi:MAG: hypothetical protein ACRDAQ_00830 [Cetobacterium sp.]
MKKIILIIAILLIFLALFRTTLYSESFVFSPYLNTPFYGNAEDDSDNLLIKEVNDISLLSKNCDSAKSAINKSVSGLRNELKNRKTSQQNAYSECRLKVPAQVDRYKKLFKAVYGREPTSNELDEAKNYYEI